MSISSQIANVQNRALDVFGTESDSISVTFVDQHTFTGSQLINGIICPEPIEEQYRPGYTPNTSIIWLWIVSANITPNPQLGDTMVIAGSPYNVGTPRVDVYGGTLLPLNKAYTAIAPIIPAFQTEAFD